MLRLGCVSCGAPLEIGPELGTFACGFCGSQQRVERKGGTVALLKIESVLKAVQRGTDRTAAELALPRLGKELDEVQAALKSALAAAAKRRSEAANKRASRSLAAFFGMILSGPLILLLAGDSSFAAFILTLLWCISVVAVPVLLYRNFRLPPDSTEAIRAEFQDRIYAIKYEIEENRAIVRPPS